MALMLAVLTFVTVTTIPVPVIRELALTAAIGIAMLMATNLCVLPVLASFAHISVAKVESARRGAQRFDGMWHALAVLIAPRYALMITFGTFGAAVAAAVIFGQPVVGDVHIGVPELRPRKPLQCRCRVLPEQLHGQHRYPAGDRGRAAERVPRLRHRQAHRSARLPAAGRARCSQYVVHGPPDARRQTCCSTKAIRNSTTCRTNKRVLGRDGSVFEVSTGLDNDDCSVMPLIIFLTDHKAGTIERILQTVKGLQADADHVADQAVAGGGDGG
ncbi:MAG: hypothetical protein WDN04_18980, partial [Rhodospirillales bacterium]